MRDLLQGNLSREGYCALLRNLYNIYESLETALRAHSAHPRLAPLYFPELFRKQSLVSDMTSIYGPAWQHELRVQPSSMRYTRRLQQIQAEQPMLLAAHAYVRYLGDLSGGQILGDVVARMLGVARGGAGTSFYSIPGPRSAEAWKLTYRAAMDALILDAEQTELLVDEAKLAFALHAKLFEELTAAS